MQCRLTFVIAVTLGLVFKSTHSHFAIHRGMDNRHKNADVFNLLLGLYKLNPLKGSQVYKTFSEYLLSGHEKPRYMTNPYDSKSNEVKETKWNGNQVKIDLSEIEKIIHMPHKKQHKVIEKPDYDIENVNTENFKVDVVMNEKLTKEHYKLKMKHIDNHIDNNFSGLFAHIESKEIEDDLFVTKLLPVNDTVSFTPKTSNLKLNPEEDFNTFEQIQPAYNTGSIVEDNNQIQDTPVMTYTFDSPGVMVI